MIEGGKNLTGSVNISGSKNSILPILAACLLTKEECIINNVPDVSDVRYMLKILASLGAQVQSKNGSLTIKASNIYERAPYDLVRKMRASICVMGPLVARLGRAEVSLPGGCVIGDRPIDLHLKGLQQLGAASTIKNGNIIISCKQLKGNELSLKGTHGTTVLGTGNIMMAATLAQGTTIINDAAIEPEVIDLANFLQKMGADIKGIGTNRLEISGISELNGAQYSVIPDRIEAGTFLIAGAMASENGITVNNIEPSHLTAVTTALQQSGYHIEMTATSACIGKVTKPRGNKNNH